MAKPRSKSPRNQKADQPLDAFDLIAQKAGKPRAEVLEAWSERAAIREYLGGLPRAEAELRAIADTDALLMGS